MKANGIVHDLNKHFKGRTSVPTKELFDYLKNLEPDCPDGSISGKIHLLKQNGKINHISRGLYSFTTKTIFQPPVSSEIKKLHARIKKELPYLNFCIWDTRWFNGLMLHQANKFYVVIETEKDAMESIFFRLSEGRKNIFLDPDKQTLERYVSSFPESIIIKHLISESPTTTVNGIETASLEKLLVDCVAEKDILASQQDELDFIFRTVFEKYNVNIHKAKRYARRRFRLEELEKMIKAHAQTLAKK